MTSPPRQSDVITVNPAGTPRLYCPRCGRQDNNLYGDFRHPTMCPPCHRELEENPDEPTE